MHVGEKERSAMIGDPKRFAGRVVALYTVLIDRKQLTLIYRTECNQVTELPMLDAGPDRVLRVKLFKNHLGPSVLHEMGVLSKCRVPQLVEKPGRIGVR